MKGVAYISLVANKVKLYKKEAGKEPNKIVLSKWYFKRLTKEIEQKAPIISDNLKGLFGIPIVVKCRSKIPNWKHIYLEGK